VNDIELLKKSREILGMTQEQLAKALDVTLTTVGRWESGARKPADGVFKSILALIVARMDATADRQCFVDETVKRLKQKGKEELGKK